jgi:PAS domain S-box-containing protein
MTEPTYAELKERLKMAEGMLHALNHGEADAVLSKDGPGLVRSMDTITLEQLLRDQHFYSRSLIEASLDPLVTISAEGKITDVNEASVQATGVPREQLIGTDFSDYFTDPTQAREGYQKVFSEGLVRDYPLAIRHVSGRIMDVLYNASVYKDNKGNVLGVFATARDVTLHKLLDQQLRERNTELEASKTAAEKANLAKSDFLSHMSHELRTPLNAILGFAQLLETGTPSPTPVQVIRLNQILKAGWYLLDLINEILDLALIESGKSSMSMEPVSLSVVLFECHAMFKPQAKENGIHLNFLLLDSTWFVHADQTKLKQVIANLLSNAIKYNSDNGTVEVKCSENTAGRLRISVKDSGAGLSAEKLAHLFQPFNRLGQEIGVKEGTGIGLAVSKKLVEMMGGTIGVESTVGVGSEFWIELDRDDASQPAAEASLPEEFVSPHKGDAASYTLLYVEDNLANLMLVEQIIEDRPHIRMLSARDGIRGVEIAQEQLPDIILMDINLTGISGIEAMVLLRNDPATKHIPIIALSANAMTRDIDQGLDAGFLRYLTKPIKINEFAEALDAAMSSMGNEQPPALIQQVSL